MQINAFLAMAVTSSAGTLNAVGIGLRSVRSTSVPGRIGPVGLGAVVEFEDGELGNHTLALAVVEPGGRPLPLGPNGETTISSNMKLDEPGIVAVSFSLGFGVRQAGLHHVVLTVDRDRDEVRLPLQVIQIETEDKPDHGHDTSAAYL